MRLLNVKTQKLEVFLGEKLPQYSILSHTWGKEEVTFKDFKSGKFKHLKGYQKIRGCCELSKREGYDFTWIDTCCIDSSSSAELSEAINSMFRWYQNAAICYAYLSDVEEQGPSSSFQKSRWFTRGWTLQELIAPDVVVFLNARWREIGTRSSLMTMISSITSIDEKVFSPCRESEDISEFLRTYSVATRMSWAASRNTTRLEDQAYCLMGLFEVNMPLLYGEGEKAFLRLQHHIMEQSDDSSIFVWEYPDSARHRSFSGLLANSPSCFQFSHDVEPFSDWSTASQSRRSFYSPRTYEVSKNNVRLRVSSLGPLRSLDRDVLSKITSRWHFHRTGDVLYGRVYLTRTLESFLRRRTGALHNIESGKEKINYAAIQNGQYSAVMLAMLDCRIGSSRVGLLFRDDGTGLLERSHWIPPIILNDQTAGGLSYNTDLYFKSYYHSPPLVVVMPKTKITMRLGKSGYGISWCSAVLSDGYEFKDVLWRSHSAEREYLLFKNRRPRDWPAFLLCYEYKASAGEADVACVVLSQMMDVKGSQLVKEFDKLPVWNSRQTSEVRVRLKGCTEIVVKIRISPNLCEIILLLE